MCGTLGITTAGQAEGHGLQRGYPGDADGKEVPFTPPAIPLCLGSLWLPRAAVKPVEPSPAYSHFLQTRK